MKTWLHHGSSGLKTFVSSAIVFKVWVCVYLWNVCMRMSVWVRALTLGASSLAFFVSGLFAVAASRADVASPADGTERHGYNKWIVCHHPTSLNSFNPQLWAVHLFLMFWIVKKKKKGASQVLWAEFQTLTHKGLDHSRCTTQSSLPFLTRLQSIQPSSHGPTGQFLEVWWLCA